ncbi:antitoxin [Terrabacter terrigena]|uniref:Antitoxin n=1 Tax=Terrabacter terrigena TaxID=574718 RepID=A0ABW3MZU1_9MICO
MSFLDKMKKKAEELDLETKARHLQEQAAAAARQAREKAGDFAAENREKIDGYVETAAAKIDEKTEGKYADKVAKVKEQVGHGVDKVAEGHTSGPTTATGAAAAAGATDVTGGEPYPVDPESPTSSRATLDDSGFGAAAGDVPAPTRESLEDTTLEDTVLGLDHPPTVPGHQGHDPLQGHDAPGPEQATPTTEGRHGQPPHDPSS